MTIPILLYVVIGLHIASYIVISIVFCFSYIVISIVFCFPYIVISIVFCFSYIVISIVFCFSYIVISIVFWFSYIVISIVFCFSYMQKTGSTLDEFEEKIPTIVSDGKYDHRKYSDMSEAALEIVVRLI